MKKNFFSIFVGFLLLSITFISCTSVTTSVSTLTDETSPVNSDETSSYTQTFSSAFEKLRDGDFSSAKTLFENAYYTASTPEEKQKSAIGVVSSLFHSNTNDLTSDSIQSWIASAEIEASKSSYTLPDLYIAKGFVELVSGDINKAKDSLLKVDSPYSSQILPISAAEVYAYQALTAYLSGDTQTAKDKIYQARILAPDNPIVNKIYSTLLSFGI